MKTYQIVTALVKVNDSDIHDKEMLAVSAPVAIDVERWNSGDADDDYRYRQNLADEVAKIGVAHIIGESPSFVDFKLSLGDLEVVDFTIAPDTNGVLLVDANADEHTFRKLLKDKVSGRVVEFLETQLQQFAPLFVIKGKAIPNQITIEIGSDYDDNNYYTTISDVHFFHNGASTDLDMNVFEYYLEASDFGYHIKELLIDQFGATEFESIGTEFDFNLKEPTEEDITIAKTKFYKTQYSIAYLPLEPTGVSPSYKDTMQQLTAEEAEKFLAGEHVDLVKVEAKS